MKFIKCKLEIDVEKIVSNYQTLRKVCGRRDVGAAVKANGYGLGAEIITKSLLKTGCNNFFVAHLEEGYNLRSKIKEIDYNILVLNGPLSISELDIFHRYNLTPILNNLWQVELWHDFTIHTQQKLPCVIHINTGMHRLGMNDEELQLIVTKGLFSNLNISYVMSHLSAAEIKDEPYTHEQLKLFTKYSEYFPGIKRSLANSSGIFLGPDYHFELSRPGAALYGINPLANMPNPMEKPVRLLAPIIHIQHLKPGSAIGYNMTFVTDNNSVIATLPLGYADGYLRSLSNKGVVYIDGIESKVVGRISMDLITIDVTHVPANKIFIGKEVEIIGENCTPDKLAGISNTIGYEILTNLGQRYERIYKNV
jgi:alanine racemase